MKVNPTCPRCKGTVNEEAEFPTCVECGWVNYQAKRNPSSRVPMLESGSSHVPASSLNYAKTLMHRYGEKGVRGPPSTR